MTWFYGIAGDHIRTLGFIDHHMLVVKVVDSCHLRVIHYTTNDEKGTNSSDGMVLAAAAACPSLLGSAGEVKEEVIEVDLAKDRHEMLEYPPGVALHTGEDAIDRARLKLKEKEYNGFSNNCESLVNWAITGKKQTNQGDTASQLAGGLLTVGVLGAIAFAVTAVLAGRKNNNN